MKTEKGKTFLTAFQNTLPIMAGYLVLGAGFGILLKAKGYGVVWAFLMSVFIYAGCKALSVFSLTDETYSLFWCSGAAERRRM